MSIKPASDPSMSSLHRRSTNTFAAHCPGDGRRELSDTANYIAEPMATLPLVLRSTAGDAACRP
jgi:hypothetical protein